MAAGLGFKDFTTGEVLTAADVDGYLMQGIWVFASATARDAAVTSPQEGNFAFTKDNNSLWYYDGAAWVASGATGDIEGVTAGVGISGGGTSGTVTITNSMATAIDAKGDLVAGTGADTFARLAVGANDTILTADSSTATGLKWAAASSGGMTVLASGTLTTTGTTLSSIDQTYKNLQLVLRDYYTSSAGAIRIRLNGNTGSVYPFAVLRTTVAGTASTNGSNAGGFTFDDVNGQLSTSAQGNHLAFEVFDYTNTATMTTTLTNFTYKRTDSTVAGVTQNGAFTATGAITEINIAATAGNLFGTYILYGMK